MPGVAWVVSNGLLALVLARVAPLDPLPAADGGRRSGPAGVASAGGPAHRRPVAPPPAGGAGGVGPAAAAGRPGPAPVSGAAAGGPVGPARRPAAIRPPASR